MLMENEISALLDIYSVCWYIHQIGINIFRSFHTHSSFQWYQINH